MANTYDRHVHTHVSVNHGDYRGTYPIILVAHAKLPRVWIAAHYGAVDPAHNIVQVCDGLTSGHDDEGDCVVSLPIALCTFWTEDQARIIEAMIDRDDALLSEAIG